MIVKEKKTTHYAFFTTFDQSAKLQTNPHPRGRPFEIGNRSFILHDLKIKTSDFISKFIEQFSLRNKVFIFHIHLVQFFLCGIGFGVDGSATTFEFVEVFFTGSDEFELFTHGVTVGCILGEGGGEVGEDGGGGGEDVLGIV